MRFKEAAEAFEVLSDADKRGRYDRYGHAGVRRRRPARISTTSTTSSRPSATSSATAVRRLVRRPRRDRRPQQGGATSRCDVTLDLLEAARGVTKTVEFERHEACDDLQRHRRQAGHAAARRAATAAAAARSCRSAGIFRVQTTCPSCRGAGSIDQRSLPTCRGTGYVLQQGHARSADSRRRRRRRCACGCRAKASRAPTAARPAIATASSRVKEHPLFQREGQHLICARADPVHAGGAGRDDRSADARRPEELKFRPARSRARCSRCAAAACPTRAAAAWATCWCRSTSRCPKACRPNRKNCCASWPSTSTTKSPRTARVLRETEAYFSAGRAPQARPRTGMPSAKPRQKSKEK